MTAETAEDSQKVVDVSKRSEKDFLLLVHITSDSQIEIAHFDVDSIVVENGYILFYCFIIIVFFLYIHIIFIQDKTLNSNRKPTTSSYSFAIRYLVFYYKVACHVLFSLRAVRIEKTWSSRNRAYI